MPKKHRQTGVPRLGHTIVMPDSVPASPFYMAHAGSGYILGAVVIASLAARLLKPSPRSRPQGVTIPNA